MNLSKWSDTILFSTLKILIVVFSVYFIYSKVISRPDFDEMAQNVSDTVKDPGNYSTIFVIVFLMVLNWLIETAKWKLLLKNICPVTWLRGFRSVLSGVTISVFTPNRMGEFAGRVLHLESGTRIKAAIASVIGSMNQLLITVVAGGIGLLASLSDFDSSESLLFRVKFLLILAGMLAAIIIYFKIPFLSRLGDFFSALKKINLYTKVFALYAFGDLLKLTFWSACRYLIFTFQFYLFLQLFGIDLEYSEAMRVISIIYLVMAVVPSIALSELTVRGSVALYFLTPLTANTAGIIASTSLLWLVNLIIPAVFGSLAAFYFRFNKWL
ncbi:MAG TPA: lysylphosphatidylglycerol synthase domain-containing protein [Bacteroidia bacterium]|nr:lysylphosphatidylglycerol synthase domain-containing protein [Bacteroidia bacterium]